MKEQLLEERYAARTRELETLLQVSHTVTSTLDLRALLTLILDQLRMLVDSPSAAIFAYREATGDIELLSYRSEAAPKQIPMSYALRDNSLDHEILIAKKRLIIGDVLDDSVESQRWRERCLALYGQLQPGVRSWMAVPLCLQERALGMLTFGHPQVSTFTSHHADLAKAFANHAAVAIENAGLFATVQRNAEQFRAISELAQSVTSILDVDLLLSQTSRLIRDTFGYYHVHIGLVEGHVLRLPARAGVWKDEDECHHCANLQLTAEQGAICSLVAFGGQAMVVPDIGDEPRYLHPDGAVGSGAVVPLKVKGEVIGLLDVEHAQPNAFEERDVAVLQLLANQVAVAIENARLYRQAQSLAALQERQKLARELHDSVSQALYGIGLGTRTALKLAETEAAAKEELVPSLEYVLSLATTGMAEMRSLIFELRPESLENEGLVAALEKHVAALQARHKLAFVTALQEPALPLSYKEALLRVAQEALHNVVKHAQATQVAIRLLAENGEVHLEIQDNGAGFDAQRSFPGHLGLESMRERIAGVGGRLAVESAAGCGTRIHATLAHATLTHGRSSGSLAPALTASA